MDSLRRLVVSPSALFAFEAAARLGSFTAAGRELNVTQAAISFSIKQLEEHLGVGLFHRHHRRVELTEVGKRLAYDVTIGFTHIRRSIEELKRRHGDHRVSLAVSTGFAAYWMVPRLALFHRSHPDVEIRMITTDKDVDLIAEGIDLGVYRGTGDWAEYDSWLFAPDRIYPVCSPHYKLARMPGNLGELARLDLIHLDEAFRSRPSWSDWFAAKGLGWKDSGKGLRLNDYALVLQAAAEGEGIALGWHHLVADSVRRGRLIRPVPDEHVTDQGIFIVAPRSRRLSPASECVRTFLLAGAAKHMRPLTAR